jgi:hypothetical protein
MKYVNDHFYELTACSSASLEDFEWAAIVADDDAEEVESNWNKMLDSKISDGIQFQLKKTWIDQDGMRSNVWVQSSNYPELDAHGNVVSELLIPNQVAIAYSGRYNGNFVRHFGRFSSLSFICVLTNAQSNSNGQKLCRSAELKKHWKRNDSKRSTRLI